MQHADTAHLHVIKLDKKSKKKLVELLNQGVIVSPSILSRREKSMDLASNEDNPYIEDAVDDGLDALLVQASQQYEASTQRFTDPVMTEDAIDVEDAVDDGLDGVLVKASQEYEAKVYSR